MSIVSDFFDAVVDLGHDAMSGASDVGKFVFDTDHDFPISMAAAVGAGLVAGASMGAEAATGAADATTLGTDAATSEVLTSGGAESTTAVGAPEAASTTEQLAQGTVAGPEAGEVFAGPHPGGESIPMDSSFGGALPGGNPALGGGGATGGGLVNSALGFAKANPLTTMLGFGAVKGVADYQAMQKKAELERQAALDLLAEKRRQAPSTGGVGVNVNIRPGDPILRRPDGTPVFTPGIVASNMRR